MIVASRDDCCLRLYWTYWPGWLSLEVLLIILNCQRWLLLEVFLSILAWDDCHLRLYWTYWPGTIVAWSCTRMIAQGLLSLYVALKILTAGMIVAWGCNDHTRQGRLSLGDILNILPRDDCRFTLHWRYWPRMIVALGCNDHTRQGRLSLPGTIVARGCIEHIDQGRFLP